jgi:hypothetical protein
MVQKIYKSVNKYFKSASARTLDIFFFVAITLLSTYVAIWCYVNDIIPKPPVPPPPQIVVVHQAPMTNALQDLGVYIPTNQMDTIKYLLDNNPSTFNLGDIVRIKYFDITGVVIKKTEFPYEQSFSVMYKDVNRQLHVIALPIEFLSRPPAGLIHLYDLDLAN